MHFDYVKYMLMFFLCKETNGDRKTSFPKMSRSSKHSSVLNRSANQITFRSNVCIHSRNKHAALSACILYTNLNLAHTGSEIHIQQFSVPEEHINIHEIVISLSAHWYWL